MSNLINQHWVGFDGNPITGRVPPTIRMMAGAMTPALQGEVAHRYHLFCLAKQTAVGSYFVSDRTLADGSRVRIVSNQGVDVVLVWSVHPTEEKDQYLCGFIFRPQNDVDTDGTDLTFWGEPFTPANLPLGTPGGSKPLAILTPKISKDAATGKYKASDNYKLLRGISPVDKIGQDVYGQIDWQGPNPKTDVISWYCESIDGLVYGNSFIPDTYMDQWGIQSYGYYGDDPDKSSMLVLRKRNLGVANAVYSKLKIIKIYPDGGLVDGACFTAPDQNGQRFMITALRTGFFAGVSFTFIKTPIAPSETKDPNGKPVPIYRAGDSTTDVVLGTYDSPALMTNMHGWYFNQSGTKARTVLLGKDDQFAVEATFTVDGVTVAEIPGSRMSLSPEEWFVKRDYASVITTGGSTRSLTNSGAGVMRSPAFMADFQGDDGVMMQFELKVVEWPTFNSTYTVTDTEAPGYPGVKHETYTSTGAGGTMTKDMIIVKTLAVGTSEERINIGFQGAVGSGGSSTTSQESTLTRSAGGWTDHRLLTQTMSAVGTPYSGVTSRSLIDADLRHGAFVFHELTGSSSVVSSSVMTYETQGVMGFPDPQIVRDEMTSTSPSTSSGSRVATVTPTNSISTAWPDVTDPGGTSTGPTSQMFWDLASPIFGGGQSQVTQGWKGYTVNEWHQYFERGTSFQSINGMIRTYYGKALSTTLVGAGMEPMPSWYEPQPRKGISHLVGSVTADAAYIAQIDAQPMPWLARLGVI